MLNALYVKNYRKITQLEIFFYEGLNIFIGENNGGKTTILNLVSSFLNNDTKIFKDILENEDKPNICFELNNQLWKLNTTSKTWKWENINDNKIKLEKIFHGFISAQPNIQEINNSMKNLYINKMKDNEEFNAIIESQNTDFSHELNNVIKKTTTISEESDDYTFSINLDWTKAFSFNFNIKNIKNIANKGLGQQKEFIINNYSIYSSNNEDYLIVDEIENSLSLNSLIGIINKLIDNKNNKQYFVSTHSPEILKLIQRKNVNVTNIGTKIPSISTLPNNFVLCEGKSDFFKLIKVFPNKLIIPGGGSNIDFIAQSITQYSKTISFKIIVDGDLAGDEYYNKINELNNNCIKIHKLAKGTIEDYIKEEDKILVLKSNQIDINEPIPNNNILNWVKEFLRTNESKENKDDKLKKIKSDLQKYELDSKCLFNELKNFIKD